MNKSCARGVKGIVAQGTGALQQEGRLIGGTGFAEECFFFLKWVSGEAAPENSPGVLGEGDT